MSLFNVYKRILKKRKITLNSKVYLSISSEGLGHSSRALAIVKEFKPDEVLIGSYNYAYQKFKNLGFQSVELSQELNLIGEKGTFDVKKTIIKNHVWALKFNQLVNEEMKIMRKHKISCVIADGRLVPVMAADKLGLPCVVITNQSAFYPFFEKDSALIKVFGKSFDWIMKTWMSSAEEILIPDFPPPYTVCLPNLSKNFKVMKRTRFVGPLVAWDRKDIVAAAKPDNDKPYIVVTLGGHSYRKPLFDNVIETARLLPDVNFDIFTTFSTLNIPDNVRIIGLVSNLAPYLKASDLVITQAGHSSAMELLTLGKPSLIVPDNMQIEQENNSTRMAELEVATKINYSELTPRALLKLINKMLNDEKYKNNAEKFALIAEQINGRKKASEVIRDYSARMRLY